MSGTEVACGTTRGRVFKPPTLGPGSVCCAPTRIVVCISLLTRGYGANKEKVRCGATRILVRMPVLRKGYGATRLEPA
eukprot:3941749-Rhodomonas_salina.2